MPNRSSVPSDSKTTPSSSSSSCTPLNQTEFSFDKQQNLGMVQQQQTSPQTISISGSTVQMTPSNGVMRITMNNTQQPSANSIGMNAGGNRTSLQQAMDATTLLQQAMNPASYLTGNVNLPQTTPSSTSTMTPSKSNNELSTLKLLQQQPIGNMTSVTTGGTLDQNKQSQLQFNPSINSMVSYVHNTGNTPHYAPYPLANKQSHTTEKSMSSPQKVSPITATPPSSVTTPSSSQTKSLHFIEENGINRGGTSKPYENTEFTMMMNRDHFEIACVSCRAKHRKCDRRIGGCTYCLSRGIPCVYRRAKKKGRQGKSTNLPMDEDEMIMSETQNMGNYSTLGAGDANPVSNFSGLYQMNNQNLIPTQPSRFNPEDLISQIRSSLQNNDNSQNINALHSFLTSHSIFQIANMMEEQNFAAQALQNQQQTSPPVDVNDVTDQLMKRLTLEDYCDSTTVAIIDKESVPSLLQNEKKVSEASALLYSIHALMCQKKSLKQEAEAAFNKARTILTEVFDKYDNFLVACTYCNLSMYCSGEGNLEEAKFYLHFVDYYFEQNNDSSANDNSIVRVNNDNLKMLRTVCEMSAGIAAVDPNEKTSSSNSSPSDSSEKGEAGNLLIGFYKLCSGEKKAPQPLLDIVSKTITTDSIKLYMTLLELVSKLFYQHQQNRNLPNSKQPISRSILTAFVHGTRVLILQECGINSGPIIEESAAKLIEISCEDKLGLAMPLILSAIATSCKIFVQVVDDVEHGRRKNNENGIDYYEIISKGLQTLTQLGLKFGRVNKMYGPVIQEMQEIQKKHDNARLCQMVAAEVQRLKLLKEFVTQSNISSPPSTSSFLNEQDVLKLYSMVPTNYSSSSSSPSSNQQALTPELLNSTVGNVDVPANQQTDSNSSDASSLGFWW